MRNSIRKQDVTILLNLYSDSFKLDFFSVFLQPNHNSHYQSVYYMDIKRILIVDDEEDLCEILKFNLEMEGYVADMANSAEEALAMNLGTYDLLLLDVMMGEISGFRLANMLKKQPETAAIPIIFITARDTENDTVTGFNLGADDYIAKPFAIREVLARVKAVLRRTTTVATPTETIENKEKKEEKLTYETLVLDMELKQVTIDGTPVALTKKELEILALLLSHPGHVFSRDEILEKIWEDDVLVLDRTVDVNITRLRKKIGEYGKRIITRQGYGYCFNP